MDSLKIKQLQLIMLEFQPYRQLLQKLTIVTVNTIGLIIFRVVQVILVLKVRILLHMSMV
ncbi:hypothetical protein C0Q72_07975 [Klebsiella pneumoniae]|nr:hypothetical protein [Klebsiella pneumoniae]MBX4681661.1 hypothetical protein [Klebsiella pneumoniae]